MSDKWAKPGDTIEITWTNPDWLGKRLVVIECPEEHKNSFGNHPSHAWFCNEFCGGASYFTADIYKVVERAGRCVSISNGDVDESLKRQLDENLRGVFG
jgi:hypothetical protein